MEMQPLMPFLVLKTIVIKSLILMHNFRQLRSLAIFADGLDRGSSLSLSYPAELLQIHHSFQEMRRNDGFWLV